MTRPTGSRPDPSAPAQPQQPGGEDALVTAVMWAISDAAADLDLGWTERCAIAAIAAIAALRAHDPEPAIVRWDDGSDLLLLGYAGGAHSDGWLAYLDTVLVQADGAERHMRFIRADRVGMQPADGDRFEPIRPAGSAL